MMMKVLSTLLLITIRTLQGAGWEAVQRLSPGDKIRVDMRGGKRVVGAFVSANDGALVIRSDSGEELLARSDIRKVSDSGRRIRNGLLWTGVGAGAGAAIGAAAGLLRSAYRTIYVAE